MKIHSESLTFAQAGWNQSWTPSQKSDQPVARRLTIDDRGRRHFATLSRIPDGTVALTLDDQVATPATVLAEVLAAAQQTAANCDARYLRFLDTEGLSAVQQDRFLTADFRQLAKLNLMTCAGRKTDVRVNDGSVHAYRFDHADRDSDVLLRPDRADAFRVTAAQVRNLLSDINAATADLAELPKAAPANLLRTWALLRLNVILLLAFQAQQPVGIAVASWNDPPAESTVTLEFIGVHPDARQQGIATLLLQSLLHLLPQGSLSAIVDACNEPAKHFYNRHRFEQSQQYSLWCWSPNPPWSPQNASNDSSNPVDVD